MIDGHPLDGTTATVVGSGFGGLATACYLADAGADVTVLEKNDELGGVASTIEGDGFRFDAGPSWYLMPDVFERFFDHFDREPTDYYGLEHLDPHYRIFWKDGDRADLSDDLEAVRALFDAYEDGAGETFDRYLEKAEQNYRIGMDRFVYEDRQRVRDFIDLDVLRSARGLSLLGSMQDHVEKYFDEPKLQQILQYTLVFLGGAPHNTPALYNLMAHVDFNLGVYYPEGGIKGVVDGIATLGEELGVTVETGQEVTAIRDADSGVALEIDGSGRRESDVVVSNANPAHVDRHLLPDGVREYEDGYWEKRTYAPSAYMLYLGVEGDVDPLAHHTLVFPADWDDHFETIFDDPAWPDDPAFYLSVASRTDETVAPDGHHAVVVLVPIAPGIDDDQPVRERYREQVLAEIADATGVDLRDRIVFEREACVSEFSEWYNYPQGTALGLAHTLRQTALFRPGHRSTTIDGLYFTGSFTTPGIGMPMCLIGAEHTADAVASDRVEAGGRRSVIR
jgi:phytoene desaturase